jgi:LPS sulfotransferase NodH
MRVTQSAVDIRLTSSRTARLEQAVGLALAERARLLRECEDFGAENARLGTDLERLRQENEALRESAEIWIRMYESQLARANRASEMLARSADGLSR